MAVGPVVQLNTDSEALINTLARASAGFSNPYTGMGTGRDPQTANQITRSIPLTDAELCWLYEQSHLVQKMVYTYPIEGIESWLRYLVGSQKRGSYGVGDEDLAAYLDSRVDREEGLSDLLAGGSIRELFFEASFVARAFGRGYLLLGIEDGQEWSDPVFAEGIKSLRWIEPIYHSEMRPYFQGRTYSRCQHFELTLSRYGRETDNLSELGQGQTLIHRSRVLKFDGVYLCEPSLRMRSGRPLSVLQGVYDALARAQLSMGSAANLLQTSSMFSYGLKGLSQIRDDDMKATILARFQSIMMSLSVLKGIPHDADQEEVGFVTRTFGGVKDLLEIVLNQVAIESDLPRHKLFEESQRGGLNNSNKDNAEAESWAKTLDSWRTHRWVKPYEYLGKIAQLAKDGPTRGRILKGFKVFVPSSFQLSEKDRLDMRKTHLETMKIASDLKALDPYEIRQTFAGAEWTYEIALLPEVSDRLEKAAIEGPQQLALPPAPGSPALPPGGEAAPGPESTPGAAPGGNAAPGDLSRRPQFDHRLRTDDATRAQKKLRWMGYTIGLQYRQGDIRHGRTLGCSYGYFERTRGVDGIACDCYVGSFLDSELLFCVDQHVNGAFDEHKFIVGVNSLDEARALFLSAMPAEMMGDIREVSLSELDQWRISDRSAVKKRP